MTMGRRAEALAEGEVAAGLDPLSLIQRNHLFWQYKEAKEYNRAMELGKTILEVGQTEPSLYALLADLYASQGRFEEAIALAQKEISASPTRTEPQVTLVNIYERMGKAIHSGRSCGGSKSSLRVSTSPRFESP